MTTVDDTRRQRRSKPSRRRRIVKAIAIVAALALAFLVGIAFAQTLDDRPSSGATVTDVRTLTPLPQGAPERTVTVTVTTP